MTTIRWRAGRHAVHGVVRLALACAVLTLAACGGGEDEAAPHLSAEAALGEKMFHDPSLSASGRQSCASCHDARFAHGAPNALAAQLGGPDLARQGSRLAPSIRYLSSNTAFHFDAEDTPTGGFFWDGRAASLSAQAKGPLLSPVEMANKSPAEVVARLAQAPYAGEFERVYGVGILQQPELAFERIAQALEKYQLEDPDFAPFSSKYDATLRKQTTLSAQEERGLALFKDAAKGNCAACHPADLGADGSHPLFTDFTYDNLGVPRNPELAHNRDPAFFDLGLCAREGGDLTARAELCGAFKVPSLRNVALRQALFHNGRFKTLKEALQFYVQRDTHPEKWYPRGANGEVLKFDDLPPELHGNVNTSEAPYDRVPGDAPALTDAEIDDVIAFLKTLTDGWQQP
ncbi:MAG: c-type cytochrome [Ottowia sp.]|nr:c-type cytochrome [Ottowia sp.]MBP7530982.1 c-type cytochrome [Ottowia sp.]MBP7535614.1 c-type cytochrome [Ottowia sp.]HRL36217.1 cytochrome c peroxidase [Ottowia beijingensis]